MSTSKDFIKAMVSLENKFSSGNSITVERAVITAEEFYDLVQEIERLTRSEELLMLENLKLQERTAELEKSIQEFIEFQPPT